MKTYFQNFQTACRKAPPSIHHLSNREHARPRTYHYPRVLAEEKRPWLHITKNLVNLTDNITFLKRLRQRTAVYSKYGHQRTHSKLKCEKVNSLNNVSDVYFGSLNKSNKSQTNLHEIDKLFKTTRCNSLCWGSTINPLTEKWSEVPKTK